MEKYWKSTEKVLRKNWESTFSVLRKDWERTEKGLKKYWESTEKVLRKYWGIWESTDKVLRKVTFHKGIRTDRPTDIRTSRLLELLRAAKNLVNNIFWWTFFLVKNKFWWKKFSGEKVFWWKICFGEKCLVKKVHSLTQDEAVISLFHKVLP